MRAHRQQTNSSRPPPSSILPCASWVAILKSVGFNQGLVRWWRAHTHARLHPFCFKQNFHPVRHLDTKAVSYQIQPAISISVRAQSCCIGIPIECLSCCIQKWNIVAGNRLIGADERQISARIRSTVCVSPVDLCCAIKYFFSLLLFRQTKHD